MQQFHLGELLKVKYVDGHRLLNKEYRASEIYARSSDYNRTLMSAYATLAGLYYPTDKTKMPSRWPSDLAWQPIPVHTAIKKSDPLMWVNYDCPKAKAVYNEVVASHPFITYNNMNKNLFAYLSVKSGMGTVNLTNLWRLHDILHVQKISNLSWPTWLNAVEELNMTNNTMYEKINNLNELAMQFLLHDEKIVQFRGGENNGVWFDG